MHPFAMETVTVLVHSFIVHCCYAVTSYANTLFEKTQVMLFFRWHSPIVKVYVHMTQLQSIMGKG